MAQADEAARGLDVSVPNAARMYDYFLGGKDNFEADRVTADRILALVPQLRQSVVENRRFIGRVVRFLAAEAGIDQFLDIGAGLPTQGNTHEVVQRTANARVVYVDHDPMVLAHASQLLSGTPATALVLADLRDPDSVLSHDNLRELIDFEEPAGLLMTAVLHFVAFSYVFSMASMARAGSLSPVACDSTR